VKSACVPRRVALSAEPGMDRRNLYIASAGEGAQSYSHGTSAHSYHDIPIQG
jgi:hypothetical protein